MIARLFACIAALALLASASDAAASVRALFVGVDHYKFNNPNDDFNDLQGTVTDVSHIKASLQAVYGWQWDQPVAGQCKSANSISITLTDACATRAAILGALAQLIQASAPGDTVMFYYAGHGSQITDSQHLTQPSGWNDTILPTDARDPSAAAPTEILDEEINVLIENANHIQGVNIVTIFDSCHSATGARGVTDGQPREIAPMIIATRNPLPKLGATGFARVQGYRVHLAAAGDSEVAREAVMGGKGPPAGVFTTALVAAINALPGASFADIIEEAQRGTEAIGHGQQHPAAEGALDQGFNGGGSPALLLAASHGAAGITLAAGSLSGLTAGSSFALFGSWTDARNAHQPPLATGHLSAVDMDTATLVLDAPAALPAQLVARETQHLFGKLKLNVRVAIPDNATGARQRAIAAVQALPFAQLAEPAEIVLDVRGNGSAPLEVETTFGDGIAELAPMADPAQPRQLQDILAMGARVDALLALRTNPATANLVTCVDNAFFPITPAIACPAPASPGGVAPHQLMVPPQRQLVANQPIHFAVANTAPAPRFVYVFLIDDHNNVTLLTPQDAPLAPGRVQLITFAVDTGGLKRFLVLATDAQHPINASVLEQGEGARDAESCASVLEKLLCQAGSGARDSATVRAGAWSAIVTTANVDFAP